MSDNYFEKSKKIPFELQPPLVSRPMLLILLGWFCGGFAIILGVIFGFVVSPALNAGPAYVEAGFGSMLMAGSLSVSLSALKWKNKSASWQFELFGWPILIFAWLLYVCVAVLLPVPVIFPTVVAVSYAIAAGYRLVEVLHSIRVTTWQISAKNKRDAKRG